MCNHSFDQIELLVLKAADGDCQARDQLIQDAYQRLKRLASKMLKQYPHVRRWEETDDVFQRAALRLWNSLKSVKPQSTRHFFNLAALQIRRELIELSRSIQGPQGLNRLQNTGSSDADTSDFAHDHDPGTDTHEASHLASWTEFHQAIDHLDTDERETFELIWYQGLTQETVAEILKTTQPTITRRWQKARRNIYEHLGRQLPE
jgi:RNA polymerase sigma factor (sigma-70 family)